MDGKGLVPDIASGGGSGLVVSAASQSTLQSGVSVSGGTSYFGGFSIADGTISGGSSVSLSSYTSGSSFGGGPVGPGGWHKQSCSRLFSGASKNSCGSSKIFCGGTLFC